MSNHSFHKRTTLYRITWIDPYYGGTEHGEWFPSASEAKRQIKTDKLDKHTCTLERLHVDTSAHGIARIINKNLLIAGISDEDQTSFEKGWKFDQNILDLNEIKYRGLN